MVLVLRHGCSLLSVAFGTNAFLLYLTTVSATKSSLNYVLKMASKLFNMYLKSMAF